MSKFSDYLRNLFLILIVIQLAPSLINLLKRQYSRFLFPKTQVGTLKISGIINDSSSYIKILKKYFKNPDIKAILLKIESPGGASGSSQAIFNEILEFKKEYPKTIISLTENLCASGGYYIACATDYIIVTPSALVGSIGSQMPFQFKFYDFIEKYQIHYDIIKAGEYKNVGDPFVQLTPLQKELLQGLTNDSYKQFTEDVAKRRQKLSLNKINEWADGKIFTGRQALQIGMIDALGSKTKAEKTLREKALIEGEIEWIKPPKKSGLMKLFKGGYETDELESNFISNIVNQTCTAIENRYYGKNINNIK